MKKSFVPLAVVTALLFVIAPILIARAPYESEMLLIQKIFYFHVPSWVAMYCGLLVCAVGSIWYLFKGNRVADRYAESAAELVLLFGLNGLVSGPLWARKAWGVWWQWDARLTSTLVLWLIFQAYLLLRRFGGPGSDRLAAGVALFGMANVPFVYWSVNVWRTVHPTTTVVPSLQPGMRGPFWYCFLAFVLLYVSVLAVRTRLEQRRAELEALYLEVEE